MTDYDLIPLYSGVALIAVSTAITGILFSWRQHADLEKRLTKIEKAHKLFTGDE
jgi:hypothetical protein